MTRPHPDQRDEACIATPQGRGAVATVLARGANIGLAVATHFQGMKAPHQNDLNRGANSPKTNLQVGSVNFAPANHHRFGVWEVDGFREEVVLRVPTPNELEIHCHGGVVPGRVILRSFTELGFEALDWRDWCASQQDSIVTQEALTSLAMACTEQTACILLDQLNGALVGAIEFAETRVLKQDWVAAQQSVDRLCELVPTGKRLTEPGMVVIAGPPNAGKSSLLNACLGFNRAIVFDQPGTTRDAIHAVTAVDGWPFVLVDTAGLRSTNHEIEFAGVQLSQKLAQSADLVLLVDDLSAEEQTTDADHFVAELGDCRRIRVGTKADLATQRASRGVEIMTSSVTGLGIRELLSEVRSGLIPVLPSAEEAVPFTERQAGLIDELRTHLLNKDQAGFLAIVEALTGRNRHR